MLKPLLPNRLLQAHVQPVAISEICRALRKIKCSNIFDGDGLSYRFIAYDCPALLNHLQIFFQSCLAQSLFPNSFLCGRVTSIQKWGKDPTSCVNYRPIIVLCFLSKLLDHLLLPEIESNCDLTPFQFGFRKSFSCSHAHHILSRLMKDAVKTKMSLYCFTVDISGAFDNIVHSQALFSLTSSGVSPSVLCLLSSWNSKSELQVTWNGQISDPVKINKEVRKGAVLSPSIFKCLLASCLHPLKSSFFYINIKIGLSVNVSNCKFVCFNSSYVVIPFIAGTAVVPCSSLVSWLGLCFGPTPSTACSS